jgi:hypothetical protein
MERIQLKKKLIILYIKPMIKHQDEVIVNDEPFLMEHAECEDNPNFSIVKVSLGNAVLDSVRIRKEGAVELVNLTLPFYISLIYITINNISK